MYTTKGCIRYALDDFALSDELSVSTVFTTSPKLGRNTLGTFFEDAQIQVAV